MTLDVAIASENDDYDGEIYRFLVSEILGESVTKWTGTFTFNGCKSVVSLAPGFLHAAAKNGVRHALLAVDNDGGSKRRPEHEASHVIPPFDLQDDVSCRECWVTASLPSTWGAAGGLSCVVVPVQVVETWLLSIRGHTFSGPSPEQTFHRPPLKKHFFQSGSKLPAKVRLSLAMAELQKPGAIGVLRARPSFQRFEARILAWKMSTPTTTPSPASASPASASP
jgi:hypothetical protein